MAQFLIRFMLAVLVFSPHSQGFCKLEKKAVICTARFSTTDISRFPNVRTLALVGITQRDCVPMSDICGSMASLKVIQINSAAYCPCLMSATTCGITVIGCGDTFYQNCAAPTITTAGSTVLWVTLSLVFAVIAAIFGIAGYFCKQNRQMHSQRFMKMSIGVAKILFDVYKDVLPNLPADTQQLFRMLQTRLSAETKERMLMCQTLGAIDCVLTLSTLANTTRHPSSSVQNDLLTSNDDQVEVIDVQNDASDRADQAVVFGDSEIELLP